MNASLTAIAVLLALVATVVGVTFGYLRLRARWLGRPGLTKKRLLTPNELDFYKKLLVACGSKWTILAQVSMGALLNTTLKPTHPRYWAVREQFSQKICDFVLCTPESLTPLLIIELDDVMHVKGKDARRDSITSMAGYHTLRFWSRNKPSSEELRGCIERELVLHSVAV